MIKDIILLRIESYITSNQGYRNSWEGCKHIRIRLDYITTISYINNMGGLVSTSCNHSDKEIWINCTDQKIWLPVVHISRKVNNNAAYMSRLLNQNTEWRLAPFFFSHDYKFFQSHTRKRSFCFCI